MEGSFQVHASVAPGAHCILGSVGPRTRPISMASVWMFSTVPPARNVIHIFVSRKALYLNLIVFTSLLELIMIQMFNLLRNHLFYLSTLHVSITMDYLQVFSVVFSYTLFTVELQRYIHTFLLTSIHST
jgi:hypothetical protein